MTPSISRVGSAVCILLVIGHSIRTTTTYTNPPLDMTYCSLAPSRRGERFFLLLSTFFTFSFHFFLRYPPYPFFCPAYEHPFPGNRSTFVCHAHVSSCLICVLLVLCLSVSDLFVFCVILANLSNTK